MIYAIKPHTWESFKLEYLPGIRIIFKYNRIRNVKVGVKIKNNKDLLFSPWYGKGGLVNGEPKIVKIWRNRFYSI